MDAWDQFEHVEWGSRDGFCARCGITRAQFRDHGPIRCFDMQWARRSGNDPTWAQVVRRAAALTKLWLARHSQPTDRQVAPSSSGSDVGHGEWTVPIISLAEAEKLYGYPPRPSAGAAPQVSVGGAGSPKMRVPGAAYRGPVTFCNGIVIEPERREIEELLAEITGLHHLLACERGMRAVRLSATWEHLPCVTTGATVRREHHPVIRAIAIGSRPPGR